MKEPSDDVLRRWLLDELPRAETEALEQRLLEDDAFGERLRAVETDLLDDLVRDRLDGRAKTRAAALFSASAEDRRRARIATALAHIGARHRAGTHARGGARGVRRVARRGARLAALIAAAGAIAVAVGIGVRLEAPAGPTASISLTADRARGADVRTIRIPEAARAVRLQVEIGADAAAGRYALDVDDGAPGAFVAHDLAPRRSGPYRFVEAVVPAQALAPGEHRVRVRTEAAGDPGATWIVRIERD